MRPTAISCALLLVLTACGDGGDDGSPGNVTFPDDTTCDLAVRTSGALEVDLRPSSNSVTCLSQIADSRVIDVGFFTQDEELSGAQIIVESIDKGETGSFSAVFALQGGEGQQWTSDCLAQISEHELVGPSELGGERYRVVGRLGCMAGVPESGDEEGPVHVDSVDFVATISWQ